MTAESQVSISFAISIFLDEKFKADDDRLNYQSYEELGLICGKCRELVFFKQGIERVSHFSHFRDTGKDCPWRTESHSNTQSSDSFKREQSLQEFQTKFRWIIEQGIIKHQQISDSQLREQIKEGQRLVSTYKIDIESSLRWFNQNREQLGNLAKSLYQSNELVSEENQIILLNFVDYLCVPASEDILRDILYYVFALLDKEISLNKYLEEVCSKVIELMSYAEWEKKYKPAKELVDTSKFEQNAQKELVDFPEYEIAPITFKGIDHPNVEEKTPTSQTKVERKTPKPIALDGSKSAPGSFELRAVIGKTPMLLTMEPSGNKWNLIALPLRVPVYDLAVYLSDKLGKTDLVNHIRREIESTPKNQQDTREMLEALLRGIVAGNKPERQEVLDSTRKIDGYLKQSKIKEKSAYSDNYYRLHTIGHIQLVQEVERNLPTYTLTVLGDEKDTRRSAVPSAINWLKRVPYNLQNHFGEDVPSYSQIKEYLMAKFPYSGKIQSSNEKKEERGATLVITDKNECIISIYYDGKLQTRQQLMITRKVTDDRNRGKIPVKFNSTVMWVGAGEFASLLKCSVADYHLIQDTQAQIERLVQKFVNSNTRRFIGDEKVVTKTPLRDILGFSEKSRGYGSIAQTFNKFCLPFTSESEVNQGKLVNLHTLEIYDRHDATKLLELMTNNWKEWNREKEETIKLGGELVKKHDPGRLMIGIHGLVNHKPEISTSVWGDVINQFYLLTELPIGFRCSNGVLLTPWDIVQNRIDLWEYRIKIQLISIIKEGDKTRALGIESLLQRDIDSLYSLLDRLQPGWNNNEDINKHLQALHDTLAAEGDNEAIPEIPDTVEENQPLEIDKKLRVFNALRDTEQNLRKKELAIEASELTPLINAWLLATNQMASFKDAMKEGKHNSLVLYLYPSYTWYIQQVEREKVRTYEQQFENTVKEICKKIKTDPLSDKCFDYLKSVESPEKYAHYQRVRCSILNGQGYHKSNTTSKEVTPQLRQKPESSERLAEIPPQNKGSIQRNHKDPIPEIGSLFYISPIKLTDKEGNIYLAQTFLRKVKNTFVQETQKVAIFEGGLLLHYEDLNPIERSKHQIKPLIVADGENIFPDLSISKIRLEYLEPDSANKQYWVSAYRDCLKRNDGTNIPAAPIKAKIDEAIRNNLPIESVEETHFLLKQGNDFITVSDLVSAPITFEGFTHPNLTPKKVREQVKPEVQTPRPIALDAAKTITGNKLITKGVIVTTPMLITLEDEADKWKISGLPVKTPPYDLAIYLSDKLGIKDLIIHIDTALSALSLESEEHKLLSLLKNDLLTGYKISKEQVLSSTKVIQGCLDRAIPTHKALYLDNYYCPHVLGYVEFLEDKEKEFLTYSLTVWGSERDTRRSEVSTVMNWLKRIPINLRKEFKSSYPSIEQIEKYLQSKFKGFRNCTLTVSSQFQGNTGIFIDVYYQGRLQTRQMLSITTPVHDKREKGKVAVNLSHTFKPMPPSTYLEVLKLSVAQKHLYQDAIGQLNRIADKWVSTNRIRFVGKEKVGAVTSVNSIVGFDSTAKSINQVLGTFKKWATPFTIHSEVEKGKLINLLTLKTYNEFDVTELLQSIVNGWKYWEKVKDEHIELGGNKVHKSDPGRLMMNVHHLVTDTPDISEIVWKDTINTFYQISGLTVGFRCVNGVVLTPYDMYHKGTERWEHRIKVQLIDLLYQDQSNRQKSAELMQLESQKTKNKDLKAQADTLKQASTIGSVESWLQYSVDQLKNKLEIVDPKWKTTKANSDVIKHLEALEEAWEISKEVEASVEI